MNIPLLKKQFLLATTIIVAAALCPLVTSAARLKPGDSFPELAKYNLEGKLPDELHGKVVLVDFWASWCGPCQASFPVLEELNKHYAAQGLVILAVSVDEKKSDMDDFLAKHPVSFTVIRDAGQKLVAAADISSMPTSFILDGDGRVRWLHNGFKGAATAREYQKEIEELLKSNSQKSKS
jgi:thiol-disulfide isomerase/thioredoxin